MLISYRGNGGIKHIACLSLHEPAWPGVGKALYFWYCVLTFHNFHDGESGISKEELDQACAMSEDSWLTSWVAPGLAVDLSLVLRSDERHLAL